jgi:hypothetical protein
MIDISRGIGRLAIGGTGGTGCLAVGGTGDLSRGIRRLAIGVLRDTGDLLSYTSAFLDRPDPRSPPLTIFIHVPSPKFARPGSPE